MNATRTTWLLGLLGLTLTACAPEQPEQRDLLWPGEADGLDPWDFEGRIDVELCGDGADNDGDGDVDEGCSGTCEDFVTRKPDFWIGGECVMDGTATGFSPFPITLGASETYNSASDVITVLSVDPTGDAHFKLRRQLLTMKLNAFYYDLYDVDVVDWNGDGTVDDVQYLFDRADAQYDSGPTYLQNVFAAQFKQMNAVGTSAALYFDETCVDDPEICDGIDNDGDGSVDESCACIEVCGDSYDNDFDGNVDEGCSGSECTIYQSRAETWWEDAECVIDGSLGFDSVPLTLGSSETYSTASAVTAILQAATSSASTDRLRHQLLAAKLNQRAFASGDFDSGQDGNGDGSNETVDELIAIADGLFDSGYSWQKNGMTLKLKAMNEMGASETIWFRQDCASDAEFCDGIDNDGDGTVDEFCGCVEACDGIDNDYDGEIDEDYPGGCPTDEVCDGIDNDGDGEIDEPDAIDALDWYADDDEDTYGNPAVSQTACDEPAGYVADNTDCLDSDDEIYPGAEDICDGKDNDCDLSIDEDGDTTYYRDLDGDDFGNPDTSKVDCDPGTGWVADDTDCDDDDDSIYPGAIDYCDDGVDQDCSGDEVGCYDVGSGDDATFIGEAAGDQAGISAARVGDVDGDGVDDVVIGARNNDFGGSDAGAAYLFYGPVTYSGEVSLANADLKVYGGASGDKAGRTVIGGEDLNGDSTDDVTIGAPNEDSAGSSSGAAYVFFGSTLSAYSDPTAPVTDADVIYNGRDDFDYLGTRTSYSELTGDSTVDLLLSNPGDSVGGGSAGGIYIYAGPLSASSTAINVSDGTWASRIVGETANDQVGSFVGTGGDLNNDGFGDLVVGVPRQDGGGTDAGATYLVAGPLSGTYDLGSADAKITGDTSGDKVGSSVSFAGDQNGDGYDDFFTSAPFEDTFDNDVGMVYLVYGTATLSSLDGLAIGSASSTSIEGKERSGQIGSSVAANGDHNGDGTNDMITGANNDGPDAEGATYLFYGPVSGTLDWSDADWSQSGETAYDHAGSFTAFGGDLQGLGGDTLIIGAREADVAGSTDAGKVYLIFDATP